MNGSGIENHELLYLNGAGMNQFGLDKLEKGSKCYKILQNIHFPCPFCTNEYLMEGQDYIWNFTNNVTGKYYRLKDRRIEWNGRTARMEIAFDMTDVMKERETLQFALDMEKMVLECVRVLTGGGDISDNLNTVLGMTGLTFLK